MPLMWRWESSVAAPRTTAGGRGRVRARSSEQSTSAPPPSVTRQQSRTWSGSQTRGEPSTPATSSGSRDQAAGLRPAQARAATATSASCSDVVPNSCMCREAASA